MTVRPIRRSEIPLLTDFLYEAIFQGGGTPLPRTVIQHPALWRYVDRFGSRRGDRCLVAEQEGVMQGDMYGLQISAIVGSDEIHYKPYVFEKRLWSARSYLHPIKQNEIEKGYMLQNPGW